RLLEPNAPVASALAVAAIRLAAEVSEAYGKVAWKGRIAAAPDPDGVVLNAGSDAGVRWGDTFRVAHRGQKLTDPANGRTLGWASQPAGTIVVTRVEPAMSTCRVIASDSPIASGDDAQYLGRTLALAAGESALDVETRV